MRTLNRVELIGRVGSDPVIRTAKTGTESASVSLATDRRTARADTTDWHRLTFWGRLATLVAERVRKGDPIWVEGELRYSTSEAPAGGKRFWTEVSVNRVIFLASRGPGRPVDTPAGPE